MKVYWHIGPHKTGTTALQRALYERAASPDCGYFYPMPSLVEALAHAQIAWRFLGLAGCPRDPDIILRKIAAARKAGFKKLVLSSEEFSRAIFVPERFESFARVCEQVECELVITLSPLPQRILPELQDAVVHGESFEPDSLADLLRLFVSRAGLRPDFLSAAILGVNAECVSVIHVDKNDPAKIYRAMSTVVGEPIPAPPSPLVNTSWPIIKIAWLSAFNRCLPDMPWERSRAIVEAAFEAAVERDPLVTQAMAPALPPRLVEYAERTWESQLAFLQVMQESGRLRCL